MKTLARLLSRTDTAERHDELEQILKGLDDEELLMLRRYYRRMLNALRAERASRSSIDASP